MKCFNYNKKNKIECDKKSCRYWLNQCESQNCCLITVNDQKNKKITLQDIGDIFDVTRMRICQIEKTAVEKLRMKLDIFNLK